MSGAVSRNQVDRILEQGQGELKLEEIINNIAFFYTRKFTDSHLAYIVCGRDWREKLQWAVQHFDAVLKPMGFNGYHYSQIVRNEGWKDKLDWAKDNFENILKPMGFNGSHYSQIVLGAGWKDKLDWVVDNYESRVKAKGVEPTHMAKIIYGGSWLEKAGWIAGYKGKLNPSEIARKCRKKNWREELRKSGYEI